MGLSNVGRLNLEVKICVWSLSKKNCFAIRNKKHKINHVMNIKNI